VPLTVKEGVFISCGLPKVLRPSGWHQGACTSETIAEITPVNTRVNGR
jgi:hypothetical protein